MAHVPWRLSQAMALTPRRDEYVARNSAADSPNAIHGEGASEYGFRSGLVPGITLLAYVCESLRLAGGEAWVQGGYVKLAYRRPVNDGEAVSVTVGPETVELRRPDGELAATGAGVGKFSGRRRANPRAPVHAQPVPMTGDRLVEIETLRSSVETVTRQSVAEDLAGFGIEPALYLMRGIAPLACVALTYFPFSDVNFVRDGPSVLVENELLVVRPVKLGEPLTVRGRIDRLFTRNGHRYMAVELGWWDSNAHPVLWGVQTSIYRLARS